MSTYIVVPSPIQKAHDLAITYIKTLSLVEATKEEFLDVYKEAYEFFRTNV